MKRDLRNLLVSLLFVAMLSMVSLAQETTGNVEVTVKDEADAVVPNATVTLESTGTSSSFKRTVNTDDSGFAKIILVPPGEYVVIVAPISGFAERRATGVNVTLGKTVPVNIVMGTGVDVNVTVTANDTGLDLTDDKSNTTITSKMTELIPRGVNMSTILKYSAATRPEPRSGQFQIDGASGGENTFIVDGQELTDVQSGFLDRNVNLPLSILQETQIKTTGFEAEFGGALGGVINMVTKSGTNQFHGEGGMSWRTWRLEPTPSMTLIPYNTSTAPTNTYLNLGTPSWYAARRSPDNEYNPTATLLGPIWKDHIWFSAAYAPQIFTRERSLTHYNLRPSPPPDPPVILPPNDQHYSFYRRAERVLGRIDAQFFDKLSVNSTFKWSPEINRGSIPAYTGELAQGLSCFGTLCGAQFTNQTGGRLNSTAATLGGSYLITSRLVVSARMSHYFLNNKLGTYGTGDVNTPTVNCREQRNVLFTPPSATQFPAGFGCIVGSGNNYPATFNSLYDTNTRDQVDVDSTYSFDVGGRHEMKGGYQRNAAENDVDTKTNDGITLYWGRTYNLTPSVTQSMLFRVTGRNLQMSPNAVGVGSMTIFSSKGFSSSVNQSYFVQDKWQPHRRLTLNLGLRLEDEVVPSNFEGAAGLEFGIGSKIAPRLGASYDLRGDGRTKIFGFYGLFYDRFKLGLPRRTFGSSELFHVLHFEIFPGDTMAQFNRDFITGGSPVLEGTVCPTGTITPIYGRVRCDFDNGFSGADAGIDPDTKPFQQREITFGVQHQMWRNYMFSARYTRKQVINAIEDASFPTDTGGENFITGNPGKGLIKERFEELGLIAPEAQRQYDVLELKLDRRFADNYFFSVNYSLSRLYGNYSGLISSDEEGTRNDPNIQRVFDTPAAGFTAAGGPDNGRLATDRPHVLKAFGTYSLQWSRFGSWKSHATDFQLFYTASSGSLITSFFNLNNNQQIILTKRGDQGRTPVFTQTDFAIRHNIKLGKDDRYNLKLEMDIINLFNQSVLLNQGANPSGESGNLISRTVFGPLDPLNGLLSPERAAQCAASQTQSCWTEAYRNFQDGGSQNIITRAENTKSEFYNVHHTWQARRTVRFGFNVTF